MGVFIAGGKGKTSRKTPDQIIEKARTTNIDFKKARRYHWYSQTIKDPTLEPHRGIQSEIILPKVLNLTAKKTLPNRQGIIH